MPRKSKPLELGGKYFQSKKELQEYVQSLLANGHRVLAKEEASVIQDLLLLHPNANEKIGTGLKYIEVSLSPQKTHNCFFVVREDGSREDFSYKHCVSECSQERLIEKRRLSAYREAVQDQIINFRFLKSKINARCELCNYN